jgi:hypothetical protein
MAFMVISVLALFANYFGTQPATPVSAISTQFLRAFIEEVTQDCSWLVFASTSRLRATPLTLGVKAIVACKRNLRRRKDARVVGYLSNALL